MRTRWRAVAALAAASVAAGALALAAPGGGGSAGAAPSHRTQADTADATLRAKATDTQLVVGNAVRGVPLDVSGVSVKGFRKVYVYGGVQHCLWLAPHARTAARNGPVRYDCAGFSSFGPHDYARRVNCLPNGRSKAYLAKHFPGSGRCTDGSPARIATAQAGCGGGPAPVYANVQPWHSTARPADFYGFLANGTPVHWRYVGRDSHWVMVHGPTLQAGQSHWYFVPRACVSAPSVHNPHTAYRPLSA